MRCLFNLARVWSVDKRMHLCRPAKMVPDLLSPVGHDLVVALISRSDLLGSNTTYLNDHQGVVYQNKQVCVNGFN